MKTKNSKKPKMKEKLDKITPESIDWVLARYLRFCEDQHSFKFLCHRSKLNRAQLSFKEKIGFKIRVGNVKKNLRDPTTGQLIDNPQNYGKVVEKLIHCLRHDLTQKEKDSSEKMEQRYLECPSE